MTNPNGLGSANAATYAANANVQGTLGKVFGYGATLGVASLTTVSASGGAGALGRRPRATPR